MIGGLDSMSPPTAAIADAAHAAGLRLWSGYIATRSGVRLAAERNGSAWSQANFENARRCGGTPIAFVSGWDDPGACKAVAAAWNVRLCLDVESGIRGDGSWVQPWLDASGAGLYGNAPVFNGRRAAFFILAAYPGRDPGATWNGPHPPVPCGWQWQGTHTEFGVGVDRGTYDDWFASNPASTLTEIDNMVIVNCPGDIGIWLLSGSMYVHIDTPNVVQSFLNAGVKQVSVDATMHTLLVQASESRSVPTQQPTPIGGTLALSGELKVGP